MKKVLGDGKNIKKYDVWHSLQERNNGNLTPHLEEWHKNAIKLTANLSNRSILEVGCGNGDFALCLSDKNSNITAVDFSRKAISIARKKAKTLNSKVRFMVADAQNLPFKDNSFDMIFSCECLEHVENPERVLLEFNRVLKENGELILTTENYFNALILWWIKCWILKKPFNSGAGVQPIEHFFLFWSVRNLIKKAGFNIKKMIGSHHVFLVLPKVTPSRFVKERFNTSFFQLIFGPLARHIAFKATKKKL